MSEADGAFREVADPGRRMNPDQVIMCWSAHDVSHRVDRRAYEHGAAAADVAFHPAQQERAKESLLDNADHDRGNDGARSAHRDFTIRNRVAGTEIRGYSEQGSYGDERQ